MHLKHGTAREFQRTFKVNGNDLTDKLACCNFFIFALSVSFASEIVELMTSDWLDDI